MKKVLKKIISMALALIMLLAMVQLPASAETTTVYFSNDFNPRTEAPAYAKDTQLNSSNYQAGGAGSGNKYYFYFHNLKNNTKKSWLYANDKDTFFLRERATNDLFFELKANNDTGSPRNQNVTVKWILDSAIDPMPEFLHIGFDIMTYETTTEKMVRTKDSWKNLLVLDDDGNMKILDKDYGQYSSNTWYNMDYYFDTFNKKAYVMVNGEWNKVTYSNIDISGISQIWYDIPAETLGNFSICLDNLLVESAEKVDFGGTYVYAGFDGLTDGQIGGKPNQIINGGKETSMWDGFYFENEITSEYTGLYMNDGATYNNGASSTIITRSGSDKAMEITVSSATNVAPQINIGTDMNITPQKENAVMHFGMDVYRYDVSCSWNLWLNAQPQGWNYDILEFTRDNKIKFLGSEVCSYNINTWYDVDIYYSTTTGKWYLYLDGELVKIATRNIALTSITVLRATWESPADIETKIAVDNLLIGETDTEPSEILGNLVLKQNDASIADNKFTAGKITAECNVVLANVANPVIVIAQYVDGTLEALGTGTYANGKATASLDVTSPNGTIKVMLLDDIDTIKPLKTSIELAAK